MAMVSQTASNYSMARIPFWLAGSKPGLQTLTTILSRIFRISELLLTTSVSPSRPLLHVMTSRQITLTVSSTSLICRGSPGSSARAAASLRLRTVDNGALPPSSQAFRSTILDDATFVRSKWSVGFTAGLEIHLQPLLWGHTALFICDR